MQMSNDQMGAAAGELAWLPARTEAGLYVADEEDGAAGDELDYGGHDTVVVVHGELVGA